MHTIAYSKGIPYFGITIPTEISQMFSGCYFKIEIRTDGLKYGLFLVSGTLVNPTEKEIEKYRFDDCKIEVQNAKVSHNHTF